MDPALVDIGAGAIDRFANSKYYDKVYDRIPNPKKRWSKYKQRRKSAGQADESRALVKQQDAAPQDQDGFGYDGNYDGDYDYDYRDSRRPRDRFRRDRDRFDRYGVDDRRQDYHRETAHAYRGERQRYDMIPYRPRPPRTEYNRRALSASGLQGGRAPFTHTDDYSEEEDEISRSRRDFTRAFVETDAFNDPDVNAPGTPTEAYSGRRSSSIRSRASHASRASRKSHPHDTYETVRFKDERETYEYPLPQDAPSGGGMKPADDYVPPPYPHPRTGRAVSVREIGPVPPAQEARAMTYRGSYSARDVYSNAPSYDREPRRHGSVRSSVSRRRRRSKSPYGNGVASAAMGALAGGFLGTELTKGDTLATVAAAVVGAVGAHEAERKYEHRKQERNDRPSYDEDNDDFYYERRRRRSR